MREEQHESSRVKREQLLFHPSITALGETGVVLQDVQYKA